MEDPMTQTKQPVLWVLVADGEHARVVTPEAVEGRFVTALTFGAADHPSYAPALRQDPHQLDKLRFGADLAHRLNKEAEQESFDRLVLVAPGHVLHAVREALNKVAEPRVIGTMPKDFCKLNDHDLSAHLKEWWIVPATVAA